MMEDNIDVDAGGIITGTESVQSVGERIFAQVVQVASGKLAKAEVLGHREFAINALIPTV